VRKLLIEFDDELDLWLAGRVNQAEAVRNAVRLYKGDISTDEDVIRGLRESFSLLKKYMATKFEYYDVVFKQLEKLINMLETRM
jgi:hypothetical protein